MSTKKPEADEELIPPDLYQCQTVITPSYSAFRLGQPPPRPERCHKVPTHIATEPPRADGRKQGSMSVCGECLAVLSKQMPGVTFQEIKR